MNLELDDVCDYVLSKIAKRNDGEYYELYPYFDLPNGELISDNGINPKRVVYEFEKYGLSKPLDNERCELTELGVKIGQGIGFKKHKENEEKNKSYKETIEKRKDAMVNHNYWITRPKNIIGIVLIILTFIGFGTYKDIMEYLKNDKENVENQSQAHKKEEVRKSNELEKKKTQEYDKDTIYSKNDSLKN
jgi:hypothetical protein